MIREDIIIIITMLIHLRKVLGVSSKHRKEDKENWWWGEEVQESIRKKRLAKKRWDMQRDRE